MKACSGCGASSVEIREPDLPSFRHLDFASLVGSGRFELCPVCGLIANADSAESAVVDPLFISRKYANSNQTSQKIQTDNGKMTRSAIQARWICGRLKVSNFRILDIGCYDGALLREIAALEPSAELHGFDVNAHLADAFPATAGIHFHSGDLASLEGPFDLITSSHSLMYVPGLRVVLGQIRDLLSEQGVFYVHTPDISVNPYSLTLGDQRYFFTAANLGQVLAGNGFVPEMVTMDEFPREAVCLATRTDAADSMDHRDNRNKALFDGLLEVREKLETLQGDRIAVLGTTVNAAFVDAVLGDRLKVFADENELRIGSDFRGKPVVHPDSLDAQTLLVLPFGESGAGIKARMIGTTQAQLIVV